MYVREHNTLSELTIILDLQKLKHLFIYLAAGIRSFSDNKLQQLHQSPSITGDRSAFVAWMNTLTNEILGWNEIKSEKGQLMTAASLPTTNVQHAKNKVSFTDMHLNNSQDLREQSISSLDMLRSLHGDLSVVKGTSSSILHLQPPSNGETTTRKEIALGKSFVSIRGNADAERENLIAYTEDQLHIKCHERGTLPTWKSEFVRGVTYEHPYNLGRNEDLLPEEALDIEGKEVGDCCLIQCDQKPIVRIATTADDFEPEKGLSAQEFNAIEIGKLNDEFGDTFFPVAGSEVISSRSSSPSSAGHSSSCTPRPCSRTNSTVSSRSQSPLSTEVGAIASTNAVHEMVEGERKELCDEVDLSGSWQSSNRNNSFKRTDYSPTLVSSSKQEQYFAVDRIRQLSFNDENYIRETQELLTLPFRLEKIANPTMTGATNNKHDELDMSGLFSAYSQNMPVKRSPNIEEHCGGIVESSKLGKSVDLSGMTFQVNDG